MLHLKGLRIAVFKMRPYDFNRTYPLQFEVSRLPAFGFKAGVEEILRRRRHVDRVGVVLLLSIVTIAVADDALGIESEFQIHNLLYLTHTIFVYINTSRIY